MTAIVCDYCDTALSVANVWAGAAKVDLCDECLQYLATHPQERAQFAQDVEENREP